jgi:hypothetical protein
MGTTSTVDATTGTSSAASSRARRVGAPVTAIAVLASPLALATHLVQRARETMGASKGHACRRPPRKWRVSSIGLVVVLLTLTLLVSGCGSGAPPDRPVCSLPSVAGTDTRSPVGPRATLASVSAARPACGVPTPGSTDPPSQPVIEFAPT